MGEVTRRREEEKRTAGAAGDHRERMLLLPAWEMNQESPTCLKLCLAKVRGRGGLFPIGEGDATRAHSDSQGSLGELTEHLDVQIWVLDFAQTPGTRH